MAASKQASIHTHVCNAVTLVWGSLKLAPIGIVELLHATGVCLFVYISLISNVYEFLVQWLSNTET